MSWSKAKVHRESLRFYEAAKFYDLYRPSYSSELIDTIIKESNLTTEDNVLEVGAGSGKATELFVERGYGITSIELGEELAQIGMEKFRETS